MPQFYLKVKIHFILQVIGRIIGLIVGIFIIRALMHYLSPFEYGCYSIALAYLQVFGIVADFGLYLLTLDYLGQINKQENKKIREKQTLFFLNRMFTLRFFSALLFYGLSVLISLFFPWPIQVKLAIALLSLALFFSTLVQMLSAYWQKELKTQRIALGEVLGKIVIFVVLLFLISQKVGFYWIISVFIFGSFVNFLILFPFFGKKKIHFCFDWKFFKNIFQRAWPIGLAITFNVLYFKADTLILSFYYPAEVVGLYGAPYRILEVLIAIPPFFLGLIMPKVAECRAQNKKQEIVQHLQKSFDFLLMLSLPLIFATQVLGKRIMYFMGGENYLVSGDILRILIIAAGILFIGEMFKQLVIMFGQEKPVLKLYFITTAFALLGYFLFIPYFAYWGASIITLLSEFLMFILLLIFIKKQVGFFPNFYFFAKCLVSSLLMAIFLRLLYNLNIFVLIILGTIFYFFVLFILEKNLFHLFLNLRNKK